MKKYILAIAIAATTLVNTSCSEWLDVNDNPNYLSETTPQMLMPTVQMRNAVKVGYELALYGSFWSQYVNQNKSTNQYYTVMTYDVTNSDFTSPWTYMYAYCLPGLKEILEKTEGQEGAENYAYVAKITLAYDLYLLNSLYGDVAYTEGYLTQTVAPHFDKDKDMYGIIIKMLEDIRALDFDAVLAAESANSMGAKKADMINGGDMQTWQQFANTLYLKMLMRDFNANESKIKAVLAEDNLLASDCTFDNFEDKSDKSNPFYESDRRKLNTPENIRSCTDILNVLDESDPRLDYYYENVREVGFGSNFGKTTDIKESGRLRLDPLDAVYFGTADEALFLKAECYARLGQVENAKTAYSQALDAVFSRISAADGKKYELSDELAQKYALDTAVSTEELVEQIINQKWASNVRCMPIESWFDLNRTGYPQRGKTITDTNGVLDSGYPQRFINSYVSNDNNPNAPAPVDVNVKMWWQK